MAKNIDRHGNPLRKGQFGHSSRSRSEHSEMARRGGRKAHQIGTAHEFTPEEAAAAGRKAGKNNLTGVDMTRAERLAERRALYDGSQESK